MNGDLELDYQMSIMSKVKRAWFTDDLVNFDLNVVSKTR